MTPTDAGVVEERESARIPAEVAGSRGSPGGATHLSRAARGGASAAPRPVAETSRYAASADGASPEHARGAPLRASRPSRGSASHRGRKGGPAVPRNPGARGQEVSCVVVPRDVELFRWRYQLAKRLLDVSVCLLLLLPAVVVMAGCAVAIWLDDGFPLVFVQSRTGRGARRFAMYKFRTMVKNAEAIKQEYWHLNKMSGPEFKLTDDPRVTRVGRWLRKYSLDELPQIFNVLLGNMSLVGPRPTSFEASKYALVQTERLEVLPGITGLAQVSGRSQLSFEEKLLRDLEYVERRSLGLDLRILLRTVTVLISPRGAY